MPDHPILNLENPVHQRVIDLRTQGFSVPKIVGKLKKDGTPLAAQSVYQIVREYAAQVRDEIIERGTQRFAEHDARYEYLYRQVQRRLARAASRDDYDDAKFAALVRAAISVLERQARLLGIDKSDKLKTPGTGGGTGQHDWLDKAPPAQLVKLAEQYDLKLPDRFVAAHN